MKRCPHCGSDLTSGMATSTPGTRGPETPVRVARVVTCPDCEGPTDGYAPG